MKFYALISKNYKVILFILVIFYSFTVPVGFNAADQISLDLSLELGDEDDDVLSYSSLSTDFILVIDGDENIISEQVYDWIAMLVNDISFDPIISDAMKDFSTPQHIFEKAFKILNPYLFNLFYAVSVANTTSFVVMEGTQYFIQAYADAYDISVDNAIDIAISNTTVFLNNKVKYLPFGFESVIKEFYDNWLSKLSIFFNNSIPGVDSYSNIISDWKINTEYWLDLFTGNNLVSLIKFINEIEVDSIWNEAFLIDNLSNIFFGYSNAESNEFLSEVYASGNSSANIILAKDRLYDFIIGEYIPLGFPNAIRDFYLTSYTNSNGTSKPTSIILQISLRPDMNKTELDTLLYYFRDYISDLDKNNKFGYDIYFLSQIDYYEQRNTSLSFQFHRVDLISIVIGLIILLLIFKNIYYSVSIILLSYLTTLSAKAIILKFLPYFVVMDDSGFSMATTIILGANLNYAVFFAHRFREENILDYKKAIEIAYNKAIHSIQISGIAIVLTLFPLTLSSSRIFNVFAVSSVIGILSSVTLISFLLPTYFLLFAKYDVFKHQFSLPLYDRLIEIRKNSKYISNSIFISRIKSISTPRNIVLSAFILALISLLFIAASNPTMSSGDFIATNSNTKQTLNIIDDKYPENYLSKILIEFTHKSTVNFDPPVSVSILDTIDRISHRLNDTGDTSNLLSIAWPLGVPIDFSNTSIAMIPRQSALTVARELTDNVYNRTYIILQVKYNLNSKEVLAATSNIKSIIKEFVENDSEILDYQILGSLAKIESELSDLINETPKLLLLSLIMLSAFLYFRLRSITIPIRLEITIILGASYAVFMGTIIWIIFYGTGLNLAVDILSIMILLGLGTDFDVFIINRIREEEDKFDTYEEAVHSGVKHSAPAVVASGLVMAGSFIALMWGDHTIIRQVGLIAAISILIDIFFIRPILVPAFLLLLHDHPLVKREK